MSRLQVIYVKCDRCQREELQTSDAAKEVGDFEARLGQDKLLYFDLCGRCKETVKTHWLVIKEWDRPVQSVMFKGQSVPDGKAAPMNPAPDYSPPKPHSLAATKKTT